MSLIRTKSGIAKKISLINPRKILKENKFSSKNYSIEFRKGKNKIHIRLRRNGAITDNIKIPYSEILKFSGNKGKLKGFDLSDSDIEIAQGDNKVNMASKRRKEPQAKAIYRLLRKIKNKGWFYPEKISDSKKELQRNRTRLSRAYKRNLVDREKNTKKTKTSKGKELKTVKYRYKISPAGEDYLGVFDRE